MGILDTIKKLSTNTTAYQIHLFKKRSVIADDPLFQNIKGKEATNKPTAGVGTPENE